MLWSLPLCRLCPHVGIVYDPKVASFLDIVGQPVGGPVECLDGDHVAEQLANLWLKRRQAKDRFRSSRQTVS